MVEEFEIQVLIRGWLPLLGSVDLEKFKLNYLIPNDFKVSLDPVYSNFPHLEGVKGLSLTLNGSSREGSLHLTTRSVGYCYIIFKFPVTKDEILDVHSLNINLDQKSKSRNPLECVISFAEHIFNIPSLLLVEPKIHTEDAEFIERLKFLGITPIYSSFTYFLGGISNIENSFSEKNWTVLKQNITTKKKKDSQMRNYIVPKGIFENFGCDFFFCDYIYLKGPEHNIKELLKVESDIFMKTSGLRYLSNEMHYLNTEINEIVNYISEDSISWIYIKNELNRLVFHFRNLVLNLERTAFESLGKINVRTIQNEAYSNVFEAYNNFSLVKSDYESRKQRVEYVVNDIRKDLELKVETEENLGNTRLIQLFSLFAILEVIFGLLQVIRPESSEIVLYSGLTLALIIGTLVGIILISKFQLNKREKEAGSIGLKKRLKTKIKNLEYTQNSLDDWKKTGFIPIETINKEKKTVDISKQGLIKKLQDLD